MSEYPKGGYAFPEGERQHQTPNGYERQFGMTLRDWFAGQALASIIAKHPPMGRVGSLDGGDMKMTAKDADRVQREIARGAYEYADAMLKARDQ